MPPQDPPIGREDPGGAPVLAGVEGEVRELESLDQGLQQQIERFRSRELSYQSLTRYSIPFRIDGERYVLNGKVTANPRNLLDSAGKDPSLFYLREIDGVSYRDNDLALIVMMDGVQFETVNRETERVSDQASIEEPEPWIGAGRGNHRVQHEKRRGRTKRPGRGGR